MKIIYIRHTLLFMSFCVLAGCLTGGQVLYTPGVYEGCGRGYRGDIRVQVFVSKNGIEDIDILENDEDDYAAAAMEELRDLVLDTGDLYLDAVSGATVSSSGFLQAMDEALSKCVMTRMQ
ncbi:MAG: FMN-binding protein [Treponema sp.]|nr:FMN-binding protein [Treponema sp.]